MAKICQLCGKSMGVLETTYNLNALDQRFMAYHGKIVCLKCSDAIVRLQEVISAGFMTDSAYDMYSRDLKQYLVEIASKHNDERIQKAIRELLREVEIHAQNVGQDKKDSVEAERKRREEEQKRREEAERERIRKYEAHVASKRNNLKMRGYDKAYEYKVISMIDGMGGRADIKGMEITLNELALDGWRVKSVVGNELGKNALSVMGMGVNSTVDELIFILEREYELL